MDVDVNPKNGVNTLGSLSTDLLQCADDMDAAEHARKNGDMNAMDRVIPFIEEIVLGLEATYSQFREEWEKFFSAHPLGPHFRFDDLFDFVHTELIRSTASFVLTLATASRRKRARTE
jgi:hypothetical protein